MKIFKWVFSVILGIMIAGLAFIFFSPQYDMYLVKSESMVPAINMGDLIFSGPPDGIFGNGIGPGTIITYNRGSELITHRVISQEGSSYITQGDAVEDPDINPVNQSQVVGTYMFKIPKLGYLVNFMHTKIGWYVCILLPAFLLMVLIVIEILKEAFKKDYSDTDKIEKENRVKV